MSAKWTEADVGDQTGRVVLITGANSGIGFEAARALVERGAHVVMACRNRDKADAARASIDPDAPGSSEILIVDMADLDSIRAAADSFGSSHARLDVLVNNAGLMATPHQRTAQGFEMQFGVNHLGHFLLTAEMIDPLLAAGASRVVTISSQGHRPGRIDFDDLMSDRKRYSPWRSYFQSKLANLLFTRELQRRLEDGGHDTIAVAAHPGASRTNLGHENPGGVVGTVFSTLRPAVEGVVTQSASMGALPTLRAATDPEVDGGDYFGPAGLFEQRGHPVKVGTSSRARHDETARRLWDVSVELTGADVGPLDGA